LYTLYNNIHFVKSVFVVHFDVEPMNQCSSGHKIWVQIINAPTHFV